MVTFGHSNAKGDLKTSKSPVPLLRGGSPQGWAYGSEYFLWIIGNMENVCTFVPSLIKVCYNLLQIRHHPNDVFSFFYEPYYRGAYSEPPQIVFTSSKQFNQ